MSIHTRHIRRIILGTLVGLFLVYVFAVLPPNRFPVGATIEVRRGESLHEIADDLAAHSVIRSPLAFKIMVKLVSPHRGVIAGDYIFKAPESLIGIVAKTTDLLFGITSVRVTIPEGANNRQIAAALAVKFEHFDAEKFLAHAATLEGFLFPDTYIFARGVSEDEIIQAMNDNFKRKTEALQQGIAVSGRSFKEIVTMASILEREARTRETRQIVSGILWKRIETGLPLQVDAVFAYLFGKSSAELSRTDLAVDSPYNTYRYKGLPIGPIANPGLAAIEDALNPKHTPYLFYLSDDKGQMHYARTFEGHVANKRTYLQ